MPSLISASCCSIYTFAVDLVYDLVDRTHVRSGLNSHYFPYNRDGHQLISIQYGFRYPSKEFLVRVGWVYPQQREFRPCHMFRVSHILIFTPYLGKWSNLIPIWRNVSNGPKGPTSFQWRDVLLMDKILHHQGWWIIPLFWLVGV